MSYLVDTFQAAEFLPVQISIEAFERLCAELPDLCKSSRECMIELSDTPAELPEATLSLLDELFPGLVAQACQDDIVILQFFH
jgi:hypothetical protein